VLSKHQMHSPQKFKVLRMMTMNTMMILKT